jgi:hypothetical protein
MSTKLTLTVEKTIIERAKVYAKKTGRSLSELIESYLDTITQKDLESDMEQLPPKLKKLMGSVKIPNAVNHKKEIRKIITSKKK